MITTCFWYKTNTFLMAEKTQESLQDNKFISKVVLFFFHTRLGSDIHSVIIFNYRWDPILNK